MAEITAALVKELRDKTNAGMMDCKKALAETNGNLDEAVKYLREKGIAKAAAKADRVASEGVITTVIADDQRSGILFELNCETDFASKSDGFRSLLATLTETLGQAQVATHAEALALSVTEGSVEDYIKSAVISIGENMMLRQYARFSVEAGQEGVVSSYIHMGGKVGVLIKVTAGKAESLSNPAFTELVKDLTLHIAAAAPKGIVVEDIDAALIDSEREIFRVRLIESGKPANMLDKILEGQVRKFVAEICLLEQPFVKDQGKTVKQLIEETGKALGDSFKVEAFARFQLGI